MDNGSEGEIRNASATQTDPSSGAKIDYRKLRSPSRHGQSLQDPPLGAVDQVWQSNLLTRSDGSDTRIGDCSLAELQRRGRAELLELASRYTGRYLDVDFAFSSDNIVMAGHQPELFHPGVWYKNFALSRLGERFNCAAINLVVDNDICGNASIRFPKIEGDQVNVGTVPIVGPGPNVPFEARLIEDWGYFQMFQERARLAIGEMVDSPIIERLWPLTVQASQRIVGDDPKRLGESIAAGRHCLENENGLRTLEIPVSWIAQTNSFAMFLKSILLDASRFQSDYNDSLVEYRTVHRIRSSSHPVPKLESIDDWIECPFWVWQTDTSNRRRLYSRVVGGAILLTDLYGWKVQLESATFVDEFRELGSRGLAIRPRALMTTMFSRLVLSDLFLHGIGGAKYDQLTDVIAKRFFSATLPGFMTLSATMKLPHDREMVRHSDITAIEQQIRETKFHPETLIDIPTAEAKDLISKKREWTVGKHRDERSRAKHLAIESINQRLGELNKISIDSLSKTREAISKRLRASEVLDSREYSFCLFPESLIEELKAFASCP